MLLTIKDLNKYYLRNQPNEVHALKNISLTVEEGELLSVTGSSGSGKSTLLQVIGGLIPFDSGTYCFRDMDMSTLTDSQKAEMRNSKIGIIMQNYALLDSISVVDNILLPMYIGKVKKKDAKNKALSLAEKVGLNGLETKQVGRLSGGQKQRVAIARALAMDSPLILADEPTGALDADNTVRLLELIKKLNDEGTAFIIVTHEPHVDEFCNKHVVIEDGSIIND